MHHHLSVSETPVAAATAYRTYSVHTSFYSNNSEARGADLYCRAAFVRACVQLKNKQKEQENVPSAHSIARVREGVARGVCVRARRKRFTLLLLLLLVLP